jgi:hypothetical protein
MALPSEKGPNDRRAYGVRPFKTRKTHRRLRSRKIRSNAAIWAKRGCECASIFTAWMNNRWRGAYRTNARNRSCDQ